MRVFSSKFKLETKLITNLVLHKLLCKLIIKSFIKFVKQAKSYSYLKAIFELYFIEFHYIKQQSKHKRELYIIFQDVRIKVVIANINKGHF